MRPGTLDEYVGQEHILGDGCLLPRAIQADKLSSVILYGPPGIGKTTLALCVSHKTRSHFERINAVSSNVEEMRKIITQSRHRFSQSGHKTTIFIDEIHRFNKAQQDVLMPDLEEGHLVLIGATVMNPFFSLISPLLSRSMVFELKPHTSEDILKLLDRSLKDKPRGLGEMNIQADGDALRFLAEICDGDARKALNALEIAALTTRPDINGTIWLTLEIAEQSIQRKQVVYDDTGDAHYDTASAFIKSMRGSDPDAALYWLGKMIYAGEDPRFIARRILICAAEDVGNADPRALLVAQAASQTAEMVGFPEARIPLAQAVTYIACAPKSNAVYRAIDKALHDVRTKKTEAVPTHLKDASYPGAKKMGHGEGYKYAHAYPGHHVSQEYKQSGEVYYEPDGQGYEKVQMDYLKKLRSDV